MHRYIILAAFFACACKNNQEETTQAPVTTDSIAKVENKADSLLLQKNDYSVVANGVRISLKDWETDVDLNSILGSPRSVSNKVLGEGADTHMGATIKTMDFNGLQLELYVPKEKDSGWIMNMRLTSDRYHTERGARVGDSAQRIKTLYPEGTKFPDGRNDPHKYSWYISDDSHLYTLKLDIEQELVKEVFIYFEVP
jgi:hypothetical protein